MTKQKTKEEMKRKMNKDEEYTQRNLRRIISTRYRINKIEYYDKLNWGVVLFDLGILTLVGVTRNYWLLLILLISGGYKLLKYEYK